MDTNKNILILGGGLSGPMLGIILAKKGFNVKIFERRQDMRKVTISAGRSINLALSVRGFAALEQVGLKEELMKICIPMYGRQIHDLEGNTNFQRYGKDDSEAIYSVPRGALNSALLDMADTIPQIQLIFNTTCTSYNLNKNQAHFTTTTEEGKDVNFTISDHLVVSADGYKSIVRESLMARTRMNFSQTFESHGYKELTIPPTVEGGFMIEKNALHIWPRGGFMLIALPNIDGNFTCTLFLGYEDGVEHFEKLKSDEEINAFFKKYFMDAMNMMPDLVQQFNANPIGSLCTMKCDPWHYEDQTVLIGDAAHALVPFYGQGMNCAFEDCIVFDQILTEEMNKGSIDWSVVLKNFTLTRKPDADAIQDMAVENFIEMRDLVNDPWFKLKKECEAKIAKKYPEFITKYSLVSFSRVPYSMAKNRGKVHDEVLSQLCQSITTSDQFDEDQGYKQIMEVYGQRNLLTIK